MRIISRYLATGIKTLDEAIRGWQVPGLYVIASRPSMGKTSFILSIIRNISITQNIPSGIITTEMSTEHLTKRLIANFCNISGSKIYGLQKLSLTELKLIQKQTLMMEESPLYIFDEPFMTLNKFRAQALKTIRLKGVKLIFIDRLDGFYSEGDDPEKLDISEVCKELKNFAENHDVTIIGTFCLLRGNKDWDPDDKDLPKTMEFNDVNNIIFLYRAEVDADEIEEFAHINNIKNKVLVRVMYPRKDLVLRFIPELYRFEDIDNEYEKESFIDALRTITKRT